MKHIKHVATLTNEVDNSFEKWIENITMISEKPGKIAENAKLLIELLGSEHPDQESVKKLNVMLKIDEIYENAQKIFVESSKDKEIQQINANFMCETEEDVYKVHNQIQTLELLKSHLTELQPKPTSSLFSTPIILPLLQTDLPSIIHSLTVTLTPDPSLTTSILSHISAFKTYACWGYDPPTNRSLLSVATSYLSTPSSLSPSLLSKLAYMRYFLAVEHFVHASPDISVQMLRDIEGMRPVLVGMALPRPAQITMEVFDGYWGKDGGVSERFAREVRAGSVVYCKRNLDLIDGHGLARDFSWC